VLVPRATLILRICKLELQLFDVGKVSDAGIGRKNAITE